MTRARRGRAWRARRCAAGAMLGASMSLAGASGAGSAGYAQRDDPAKVLESLGASGFWEITGKYYRETPFSERVTVSVRIGDGPARTSVLWVQGRPALAGAAGDARPREPRTVRIRAGELRIVAEGETVRVASARPDSPYFESTRDETATGGTGGLARHLEDLLPPLPLPQLDLVALPSGEMPRRLTSYAREIHWSAAPTPGAQGTRMLGGSCKDGSVGVAVDARTGRLRKVQMELMVAREGVPTPVRITLDIAPAGGAGGDIAEVVTEGRQRVSSIAELAIQSTPAVVGKALDLAGVQTRDLASAMTLLRGANAVPAPRVVVAARIRGSAGGASGVEEITVDEGCVESTVAAVQRAASGAADAPVWVVLAVDAVERAGAVGETGGNGNGPGGGKDRAEDGGAGTLAVLEQAVAKVDGALGALRGRVRVLRTSDRAWIDKHLPDRSPVGALTLEGAVVTGLIVPGADDPDLEKFLEAVESASRGAAWSPGPAPEGPEAPAPAPNGPDPHRTVPPVSPVSPELPAPRTAP